MIRLTRKAQYGIRGVVDLCLHASKEPVLLKDIAERENISLKYLEQIFGLLKIAGIISNRRGPEGGYYLTRAPEKIKLSDIILALEGDWDLVECKEYLDCCSTISACVSYEIWKKATEALTRVFESTSLKELIRRYKILEKREEELFLLKQKWHQ